MATDRILYINACVRERSRTDELARALLSRLEGDVEELRLKDADLHSLSEEDILRRDNAIAKGDYAEYGLAKQFASADILVIAAPNYDLSFPSLLKVYLENIYVMGVVTRFTEEGRPEGLCRAKKLYYVATSGGKMDTRFGYDYVRALATEAFGIAKCELIYADMLDVFPEKAHAILEEAKAKIRKRN